MAFLRSHGSSTENGLSRLNQKITTRPLDIENQIWYNCTLNASSTSIGGTSILTISPALSTTGLTVNSASGAIAIGTNVALGAAQTWTNNNATDPLAVALIHHDKAECGALHGFRLI